MVRDTTGMDRHGAQAAAEQHAAGSQPPADAPVSIVLAGGGTAGHVNPLLSIAAQIRSLRPQARIRVIGTAVGLEADLVPKAGFPLETINKVPFPRRINKAAFEFPARWHKELAKVTDILTSSDADAVVGVGGYAAAPAYSAAHHLHLPLIVHEQNARAGLANRLGARWADYVGTSYESTGLRPGRHTVIERVGLPLRPAIARAAQAIEEDPHAARVRSATALGLDPDRPILFVTGGSLGAVSLNKALSGAARDLLDAGIQIVHLTGKKRSQQVRDTLAGAGLTRRLTGIGPESLGTGDYHMAEYFEHMELAFSCADLVICRSGAGTVSEIAALGVPAVYVPLPIGNGEQRFNAEPVVQAGGGLLVADADLDAAWVRGHVPGLLADADRLARMRSAARSWGIRDAADRMARKVLELADAHYTQTHADGGLEHVDDGLEPRPLPSDDALAGLTLHDLGRVWFIGIGGSGMSVLALLLHEQGVPVAGSDREESDYAQELEQAGVRVVIGQKASNIHDVDTVVWSSAIAPDQCEMAEARRQGLRLAHRSDILALLLRTRRSIAVAGTHGKTTTSSMIAAILTGCGADPSFAIGGSLKTGRGIISGGHAGKGEWMVAEADESDGSFAKYTPLISVITNAEGDHLDHYGTVENYRAAFGRFAHRCRGAILLCGDDAGARQVYAGFDEAEKARTIVYTTDPDQKDLGDVPAGHIAVISDAHEIADESDAPFGDGRQEDELTAMERQARAQPVMEEFTLSLPDGLHLQVPEGTEGLTTDLPSARVDVRLSVPGLHNARNATAAILAAALGGQPLEKAAGQARTFLGAARRFDFQGQYDGIRLYTDYGHHPTEVATFLRALRSRYPHRAIRVLFQPHSFSRVKQYAPGYAKALALADEAVLVPVFPARERQEDFPGITSATIVEAARATHGGEDDTTGGSASEGDRTANRPAATDHPARSLPVLAASIDEGADRLLADSRPGDVLATIGAGSIEQANPRLLRLLADRQHHRSQGR